jgi:hypothetical protein
MAAVQHRQAAHLTNAQAATEVMVVMEVKVALQAGQTQIKWCQWCCWYKRQDIIDGRF